jgi:hypothetical protein
MSTTPGIGALKVWFECRKCIPAREKRRSKQPRARGKRGWTAQDQQRHRLGERPVRGHRQLARAAVVPDQRRQRRVALPVQRKLQRLARGPVVYVRRHGAAGGPYTLARNEHVRVDLVYGSVSERTRIWIDIFGGAVGLPASSCAPSATAACLNGLIAPPDRRTRTMAAQT